MTDEKSQSQNTAQLDKMEPFELIGQQAASLLIKVDCRIFQLTFKPANIHAAPSPCTQGGLRRL